MTFLDFGGIERKMENLSLWQDNNEWIFIAIGKGGVAEKKIGTNGKRVHCLNLPHKIPSIKAIFHLYKLMRREKPDVVHTAGAEANFHGIIASNLARIPIKISEEIGIPNHGIIFKMIFNIIFNISDYIVGESISVTSYLRKNYRIPNQKIKTISNFIVNKSTLNRNLGCQNLFNIVSVSRLAPVKNIEDVLFVLKRLSIEGYNVKYTIVGDGSSRTNLENIVRINNINVTFVGYQAEPYSFFMNADLFILNSFSEGFSNSLIEAMHSCTPSLSTSVGAAEEIIIDEYNGWLIPPNDADALYLKIKHVLSLSNEQRLETGKRGHETAKKYSLEGHITQLMKLYAKN